LQQTPVGLRETPEKLADFAVIGGHGPDPGHQFLADVFGDGFLVHLGGEVIAALGRILMERALEEVEGVVDLAFELFLAELEDFVFFAHMYAYIYAYSRVRKSARQQENVRISAKNRPKELNYYPELSD
jgi:hypothetical protein